MKEILIILSISFLYLLADIIIFKQFYKDLRLGAQIFYLCFLMVLPVSAFFLVLLISFIFKKLGSTLDFGHAGEGPLVAFFVTFLNAFAFFLVMVFDLIKKYIRP